jgi:hypothetical protein
VTGADLVIRPVRGAGLLGAPAPSAWLLVLDDESRLLFRAVAEYYPPDELARLEDALAVPWQAVPEPRPYAELRRELPGSFPWASRTSGARRSS